jgi:hypothetical protein
MISPVVGFAVRRLAAACGVLLLLSCGRHSTSPAGHLQVHVSVNGDGPSVGKKIELQGTSLFGFTDEEGIVRFTVPARTYVVRAYGLGQPGPGRPYVEKSVPVESGHTSSAEFNDCTMCR